MLEFAILGLHRSGTNYIARTMDINFRKTTKLKFVTGNGAPNDDGSRNVTPDKKKDLSKHLYGYESHDIPVYNFVLIHKSPYQWIDSVKFRELDFRKFYPNSFVNGEWNYKELARIYNEFHIYWKNAGKHRNIRYVKYEDLLTNTAEVLDGIKDHWELDKKFESYTMPTRVHQSTANFDQSKWDKQFYTDLPWDAIEQVNAGINRDTMRVLGYDFIEDRSDRRHKNKDANNEQQSSSQLAFDF
jgi:hypothetical protein